MLCAPGRRLVLASMNPLVPSVEVCAPAALDVISCKLGAGGLLDLADDATRARDAYGAPRVTLGRAAHCDLVVRDRHISGEHCALRPLLAADPAYALGFRLRVLDTSSNGTWVRVARREDGGGGEGGGAGGAGAHGVAGGGGGRGGVRADRKSVV